MKSANPRRDEELTGWSGYGGGRCQVAAPQTTEEAAALIARARQLDGTLCPRGAGSGFGDVALNRAAIVLETTHLNRILAWDPASGVITVEPGVTLGQLWRHVVPDGWWPVGAPEYSGATVAGAVAADAYGRESWRLGTFGDAVLAFDLLLSNGEILTCSREAHPALFHAAIGGWGLLGCFIRLTLQLRRIASGDVWEVQSAHRSLADLLAAFEAATEWATFLAASLDPRAPKSRLGRGLLRAARDLAPDEEPDPAATLALAHQEGTSPVRGWRRPTLAAPLPAGLKNRLDRQRYWRQGHGLALRRSHLRSYAQATFAQDDLAARRALLAPHGLARHVSFIPRAEAEAHICALLACVRASAVVPLRVLLKRLRPSQALLGALPDGYALELDLPLRAGGEAAMDAMLRELNALTIAAGGAGSFAADSTLTAEQVERMLGAERLAQFRARKAEYDPQGLFCSDLYRRVIAPGGAALKSAGARAIPRAKHTPASRPLAQPVGGGRRGKRR
ncbi:MAG TPA: FAD-binding oxidoreductase [Ktedonobacterales bacterium]